MSTLTTETDHMMARLSDSAAVPLAQTVDEDILEGILADWDDALVRLQSAALIIETDPANAEAMGTIKRTLHTLKGDSAICGLPEVSGIFHEIESLLENFIEKNICPTDMLLKVHDWLHEILAVAAGGTGVAVQPASPDAKAEKTDTIPAGGGQTLRALVVDDDFTNRLILQEILKKYGTTHIAVNGKEAVSAVHAALESKAPYNLICLDIMMPEMDGQAALKEIRAEEESRGILSSKGAKIIMITALDDLKNVAFAYGALCDGYMVKPIDKGHLIGELRKLALIQEE